MMPALLRKHIAACIIAAVASVLVVPASATDNPWANLFLGIINQAIINSAIKKWNAVDPDIRQCLLSNYGLNAAVLAQNGVVPTDYRLQNQMRTCVQTVAQARYQVQQQQLAAEQQQEALKNRIAQAQAAWLALDPQLTQCLKDKQGSDPYQLGQQGIAPHDPQLSTQLQTCRGMLAQQHQEELDAKARHKALVSRFGEALAAEIEDHKVAVGMSEDAVREALGKPENVEQIPPDDELWVYGSQRVAISKGRVTFIEH